MDVVEIASNQGLGQIATGLLNDHISGQFASLDLVLDVGGWLPCAISPLDFDLYKYLSVLFTWLTEREER